MRRLRSLLFGAAVLASLPALSPAQFATPTPEPTPTPVPLFERRSPLPHPNTIQSMRVPPQLGGQLALVVPFDPGNNQPQPIYKLNLVTKELTSLTGALKVIHLGLRHPYYVTADGLWVVFRASVQVQVNGSPTTLTGIFAVSPYTGEIRAVNDIYGANRVHSPGYFTVSATGSNVYFLGFNDSGHLIPYVSAPGESPVPLILDLADQKGGFWVSPDETRLIRFLSFAENPEIESRPVNVAVVELPSQEYHFLTVEGNPEKEVDLLSLNFRANDQVTYALGPSLRPSSSGPGEVFLARLTAPYSLRQTTLVQDNFSSTPPAFSPDGNVAFILGVAGPTIETGETQGLYRIDLGTGAETLLSDPAIRAEEFVVSPDGQWIAYQSANRFGPSNFRLLDPDGTSHALPQELEWTAWVPYDRMEFSPDSRYLVLASGSLPTPGEVPPYRPNGALICLTLDPDNVQERLLATYTWIEQPDTQLISPLSDQVAFAAFRIGTQGRQVFTAPLSSPHSHPFEEVPLTLVTNPVWNNPPLTPKFLWLPSGNLLVAEEN